MKLELEVGQAMLRLMAPSTSPVPTARFKVQQRGF